MSPPDTHTDIVVKIRAILQEHVAPAGLLAAVASSSRSHFVTAGKADIIKDEAILGTHCFGIGSITKIFVAVVIFQLIEEEKLKLSDRVDQYLATEVLRDIDNANSATIQQLLGHTAGIDSWEDDPDWIVHGRGRLIAPAYIWSKTEPLDYIRRPRKTAPTPGNWYYANTNYTLLGLIMEKITGIPAEMEIRRRIIQPLQLHQTYLEGFEEKPQDARLPSRYHLANANFRETAGICPLFPEISTDLIEVKGYNMSASWLAGGMISTAADLLKFGMALRDGKLLAPKSMAFMHQWQSAGKERECGHGLFRMELQDSGKWLGHAGGVLGFSSGLWWHEEEDCVICVLGNLGIVHTGGAVVGVKAVISSSDFPALALQLV